MIHGSHVGRGYAVQTTAQMRARNCIRASKWVACCTKAMVNESGDSMHSNSSIPAAKSLSSFTALFRRNPSSSCLRKGGDACDSSCEEAGSPAVERRLGM